MAGLRPAFSGGMAEEWLPGVPNKKMEKKRSKRTRYGSGTALKEEEELIQTMGTEEKGRKRRK